MELQVHESVLKKYHSIVTVTFNLFCNSVDEIKQRTTSGLESSRSITSKFPLLCTGQNSSSPPSLLSGSIWLIPAGRVWPVWCVSLQWPGQDSPSTQLPPLWWLLKDLVLKWQSQRSRHFLHHWWWGAAALESCLEVQSLWVICQVSTTCITRTNTVTKTKQNNKMNECSIPIIRT